MQYQYPDQMQVRQKPQVRKEKGGSIVGKIISTVIKKVILSPLVVFIVAYFYFGQDVRKALLASLYFYTALTAVSIIMKLFGIFTSAVTFNPFKFIKKSLDLIVMLIVLIIYWFLYSLYSGANFNF